MEQIKIEQSEIETITETVVEKPVEEKPKKKYPKKKKEKYVRDMYKYELVFNIILPGGLKSSITAGKYKNMIEIADALGIKNKIKRQTVERLMNKRTSDNSLISHIIEIRKITPVHPSDL